MTPSGPAKPSLTSYLEALRTAGGLRLEYRITSQPGDTAAGEPPRTEVELSGPDAGLLLERNGELLHAIESLAAAILRLEPEQVEQLSFDAQGFKASRAAAIERLAAEAIATVRASGKPFPFAPMNSRERRLLHLALLPSGLATASSGMGPRRFVVLYPEGQTPEPERFEPPVRQPGSSGNRSGYRSGSRPAGGRNDARGPREGGFTPRDRSGAGRNVDVNASSSRPEAEPNRPHREDDAESLGNRAESPADPSAAGARLDSIRRAFRKR